LVLSAIAPRYNRTNTRVLRVHIFSLSVIKANHKRTVPTTKGMMSNEIKP